MNPNYQSITGPFAHDNLSIFLLRGNDAFDGSRFIPLDQAMEQKCVIVHETGNANELEVENLSDGLDLYIQAGDVVKGGQQDRTLGVDFVLPAKSGRVPIPSFCVESGRWTRRPGEDVSSFSSSKSYLSSKKLRMAAKMDANQSAVWEAVAATQAYLGQSLQANVYADASPTSYQLTVEHADLQQQKEAFRATLAKIIDNVPDAIGYAFAINGVLNTADVYGSATLFRKLWSKLLDAAVIEAISESFRRTPGQKMEPVSEDSIRAWFDEASRGAVAWRQEVPPRVSIATRRSEMSVIFDTHDHGLNDALLHQNLVAN